VLLTSWHVRPTIGPMTPPTHTVFFGRRGRVTLMVRGHAFTIGPGVAVIVRRDETLTLTKDNVEHDAGGVISISRMLLATARGTTRAGGGDLPWLGGGTAAVGYGKLGPAAVRLARRMIDADGPDALAAAVAAFLDAAADAGPPDLTVPRPAQPPHVKAIRRIVDEEMPARLRLAEIGRAYGTTPGHLIKTFARYMGVTPHQYLNGRRSIALLFRLMELDTLAEAAAVTNYSDQSHMSRDIKARFGLPPGMLRQLVKVTS
jgi:AraC-like DNA-binding protein